MSLFKKNKNRNKVENLHYSLSLLQQTMMVSSADHQNRTILSILFINSLFLKGIFTSNFHDMRKIKPSIVRIDKNVVSGTKKFTSLASWGVERRDPGNEVGATPVRILSNGPTSSSGKRESWCVHT